MADPPGISLSLDSTLRPSGTHTHANIHLFVPRTARSWQRGPAGCDAATKRCQFLGRIAHRHFDHTGNLSTRQPNPSSRSPRNETSGSSTPALFSLILDLVAYENKHNLANGENNADGSSDNLSWNCGIEGPTDDTEILAPRRRQIRNFATLLFIAQGIPMITAGDESGRSQNGNNNAYCQDNDIGWVRWDLRESQADLLRFVRYLIVLRHARPLLRNRLFGQSSRVHVEWHGTRVHEPDWSHDSRSLGMLIRGSDVAAQDKIFVMANAFWQSLTFDLPRSSSGVWFRIIDTSLEPSSREAEVPFRASHDGQCGYTVAPRSVVVLVAKEVP